MLLHGLEKCSLSLGRGAVDLIGQDHVGEDGSFFEDQFATCRCVLKDFGACNVRGHQIRGELDPMEAEVEHLGDGFDEQRFGQSWSARDEAMTAGKQGDEHLLDDVRLADDDFPDLRQYLSPGGGESFDNILFRGGRGRLGFSAGHHGGVPNSFTRAKLSW